MMYVLCRMIPYVNYVMMYVDISELYDVLVVLDAFDDIMMIMMYDVYLNMMMFSILNMLYDDECHVASCREIDLGHNPK